MMWRRRRFECALARNPNHLQAAIWLGDLHYRAGRLPEAISIYQSARDALAEERRTSKAAR